MQISISDKNTKMGNIPSFSQTPGRTCSDIACRTCLKDCYAMKAYKMYKNTKSAYDRNADAIVADMPDVFAQLRKYLAKKNPRFSRVHVAGDFVNSEYLQAWLELAREFPKTNFLAFTKMYSLFTGQDIPANMQIIFSAWPGVEFPTNIFPIAWMQDGTENRLAGDEIECPGHCDTCGMCFQLGKLGKDVVFHKH